jgi:hypothetical protein
MRQDDEKKLDEMLKLIRDELENLITKQINLFRVELKDRFPGPWPIVADRIERARDGVKDLNWVYVEGVGMIGQELAFKYDLLKDEVQDGKGRLKEFLKRADSILGSLGTVLPVLEPVKEYKEHVECSIENLDNIKRVGGMWQ